MPRADDLRELLEHLHRKRIRLARRRNLSSINSIHDASLTRESPWPSVPRVEETAIFSILTPQPSTLFSRRDPRTTLWIRRDAIENM